MPLIYEYRVSSLLILICNILTEYDCKASEWHERRYPGVNFFFFPLLIIDPIPPVRVRFFWIRLRMMALSSTENPWLLSRKIFYCLVRDFLCVEES